VVERIEHALERYIVPSGALIGITMLDWFGLNLGG
jgi:hypothetical protein